MRGHSTSSAGPGGRGRPNEAAFCACSAGGHVDFDLPGSKSAVPRVIAGLASNRHPVLSPDAEARFLKPVKAFLAGMITWGALAFGVLPTEETTPDCAVNSSASI